MTDAVREYREAGRFTLTSLSNASSDQWFVPASLADAAIAELEKRIAKLEAQKHGLATAAKLGMEAVARAEKATEYARIEVKRKNEAVEREAAAIERAEKAEAVAELRGQMLELAAESLVRASGRYRPEEEMAKLPEEHMREQRDKTLTHLRARAEKEAER